MLTKKTLVGMVGTEYEPMIKKISIPDFTKCVAQYSGIPIKDLSDDIIAKYLSYWCRNKKYLFDLFGHNVKVDMPIEYTEETTNYEDRILAMGKDYPAYYPWLKIFADQPENKINARLLLHSEETMIGDCFPNYNYNNVTLTHFFKSKLNAPDELVTALGRIFENTKIKATYTLSIDPVDIMFSSENPYNWTSCYRLEDDFESSHADGCLAGVLDESTVITYIWNHQGKYSLYNTYDFKDVRYKMARMTIAINKSLDAIHFNQIYPYKDDCSENFTKLLRDKVETFICEKTGKRNLWKRYSYAPDLYPYRRHEEYGYGEYNSSRVWMLANEDENDYDEFNIYNETITCPCDCGNDYYGTDNDEYMEYHGNGHVCEHYVYEPDEVYDDEDEKE